MSQFVTYRCVEPEQTTMVRLSSSGELLLSVTRHTSYPETQHFYVNAQQAMNVIMQFPRGAQHMGSPNPNMTLGFGQFDAARQTVSPHAQDPAFQPFIHAISALVQQQTGHDIRPKPFAPAPQQAYQQAPQQGGWSQAPSQSNDWAQANPTPRPEYGHNTFAAGTTPSTGFSSMPSHDTEDEFDIPFLVGSGVILFIAQAFALLMSMALLAMCEKVSAGLSMLLFSLLGMLFMILASNYAGGVLIGYLGARKEEPEQYALYAAIGVAILGILIQLISGDFSGGSIVGIIIAVKLSQSGAKFGKGLKAGL